MRKTKRNWLLSLCGALAAFGLFTGIWACTPSVEATAAGSAPTVTMVAGASARKVAGETGIKFTAKIDNYNRDYKYGMLILPEAAWSGIGWNEDTNYLYSLIEEEGISTSSFANQICTPYQQDGEWFISFALKNIRNFNMSFVGVAYSCTDVNDFDTYTYTYIDQMNGFADNGRSMSYVAQMALKYDESLTSSQKSALKSYTSGSISIEEEDYLTDENANAGGTTVKKEADYALKYHPNVNDALAFVSKTAYAEGSVLSFDYYISSGGPGGWWGIAWNNNKDNATNYDAAGEAHAKVYQGHKSLDAKTTGAWLTATATLTSDQADGNFYFYIGSDCGSWKLADGSDSYILLDNFKINGVVVEDFASGDLLRSNINVKDASRVSIEKISDEEISFGESGKMGEYAAKLDFTNSFGSDYFSFITKTSVAKGGDTVSFKYYIPEETTIGDWWSISWTNDLANQENFWAVGKGNSTGYGGVNPGKVKGEWVNYSITIAEDSSAYWLYFCGYSNWNGCVYVDDFKVTRNGEVIVEENFNKGVKESIFNYNSAHVSDGEGFVLEEKGELAMQYKFNKTDIVTMITKQAYAEGSTVSFKYFIPASVTKTGWWGIAWNTDASKANNYHAAGIEANYQGNYACSQVVGEWTEVSFTINSDAVDGNFYLYFGFNHGAWTGSDLYILIDDFTVNGKTETFNYGLDESIFTVKEPSVVAEYDLEARADVEEQELAMKILLNNGDDGVRARTTKQYAGGSTVSFKYYFQADQKTQWTRFIWDEDTTCDNYAGTYTSFGNTAGEWVTWSYTLPAGGPYYLYLGFECGNWGDSSGQPYVLIDDFTVNGETETFNYGLANSSWTVLQSQFVSEAPGYATVSGSYAARIQIDLISSTKTTPSFITAEPYVSDGTLTVSFDYYLVNPNNKWWTLAYTTSNTNANIYAGVSSSNTTDTNNAFSLPTNVQNTWTSASYTIPAGTWYFYFAGAVGEWGSGYFLIDNFRIGNQVTETFNDSDSSYGIFLDNRSSKPDAITIAEGKEDSVPDVGAGSYAAKLQIDLISGTKTTPSFITAKAYTLTEPTIVSLDYYMSGNTNSKWWALLWTNDNTVASIYAHAENNKENNDGRDLPKNIQDAWATASIEVPAGTWYFYIGGAVGEWTGGYVLVDNFRIGNQVTETFDDGTYGIFLDNRSSKPDAITIAEGKANVPSEPVGEDVAAQINVDKFTGANVAEFVTKDSYAAGSVVEFDYFIPSDVTFRLSSTWWTLCVTTDTSNADVYSNHYATLPKVQGEWQHVSVTLNKAGYIYFGGAIGEWNGGCVYIDNFTVTLGGEVVASDDFNYGVDGGLFVVNNNGAIVNYDGASQLGANPDPYAFENLLKDEANLSDVLENGGYASLISEVEVDATDLPVSSLLIEGSFAYTITGEKEFAIYFGNNYYIYINGASIALYNGTTKVKEIAGSADATFYLAVTVGGKIAVRINDGGYVGLGSMNGEATMVKVVALGGDGNIQFANFNIVTYKCNWLIEDDIPLYVSEEQIDFTAYAYDSDAMVSDAGFQLLSEAGFTKGLALLQGRAAGVAEGTKVTDEATVKALMEEVNRDAHKALELAEKYGMKQYVMNIGLYNLERAKSTNYDWIQQYSDAATYLMSEAYAGHFFADEPKHTAAALQQTELEELVLAYKAYKEYFPDGDAYINLLPISSSTDSTYKTYVKYYIENIALDKDGVKGTGYVSFDIYPLKTSSIETKHLRNFEIVAEMCRDYGIELRYYIKASTTGDGERSLRAVQSINDIYVQLYAGLVYGGKEIIYYNFTDHTTTDGTAGDGVISGYSLEKGNVYNWAKQANNEIAAFSAAYMNFTWNSASISGSCTQFNQLASEVSIGNHGSLSAVSSSAKVLIGNFTDSDGKYTHGAQHAYMAMNYGDPRNGNTGESSMTFTFNGKSRALVYENGKPTVYTLSSNQLTLNLQVGEGAFIIPLN